MSSLCQPLFNISIPNVGNNTSIPNQNATVVTLSNADSFGCGQGLYCPFLNTSDPLTVPVKCLPTPECELLRLLNKNCPEPMGKMEPQLCSPGFYCPAPQEKIKCPKGYFCPSGSFQTKPCDLLSSCPEGSIVQKSYTGIFIAFILDIFLILACLLQYRLDRNRRSKNVTTLDSVKTEHSLSPGATQMGLGNESVSNSQNLLVESFKRAMNGTDTRMDFRMEQLGYALSSGKEILQSVLGEIHSGKMTAIIGPSGAGKTTFMNVLCGKVTRTSGKLFISGDQVELKEFKKICGFVPQDDIMHNELTVRENILHSARIRVPNSWSQDLVNEHVDTILQVLKLSHVAQSIVGDVMTGGISGGQRKRVNIGMELAATPLCLCLDEPTSGLDSTSSLQVMDTLEQIASVGVTVVAVIHQPRIEIFRKFDDVLMIVQGGKTAYFGPANQAKTYFEEWGFEFIKGGNDADILMDILSGLGNFKNGTAYTIDDLVQHWESNNGSRLKNIPLDLDASKHSFAKLASNLVKDRGASFLKQVYFCAQLSLLQQYRTYPGLVLELLVGTLAGALMGMAVQDIAEIYSGMLKAPFSGLSAAPVSFLACQFTMMIGMAIALASSPAGTKVFSEELVVYKRNASAGHSSLAYYLAKTIAVFPRIFLAGIHFSGVLFYLSSPVIPFWIEWLMITLFVYCVYGLCAFVSMVVKRENSTLLAVVFALFSSVFCGYGPTLKEARRLNLKFVWDASYAMYATEAHFSETLGVYDHVFDNSYANDFFGFELNRTLFDFVMMFVIGTLWRVIAYIAMIVFVYPDASSNKLKQCRSARSQS